MVLNIKEYSKDNYYCSYLSNSKDIVKISFVIRFKIDLKIVSNLVGYNFGFGLKELLDFKVKFNSLFEGKLVEYFEFIKRLIMGLIM